MSGEGDTDACAQCGGVGGDHDDGCSRPNDPPEPPTRNDLPHAPRGARADGPTFALAIPHTPWVEARHLAFARLIASLDLHEASDGLFVGDGMTTSPETFADGLRAYHAVTSRMKNHEWSGWMWNWALGQRATHFVQLQDDAVTPHDFWPQLQRIVRERTHDVIGLHAVHPLCAYAAHEGYAWASTTDGLVGVGYVLPMEALRAFLAWRSSLPTPVVESTTEDTLIGLWCASTGRRVMHPVPTIVDHDTSLESTYGNDAHSNRRSVVRWDTELAATAHSRRDPRLDMHLGRLYESTPHAAFARGLVNESGRDALTRDNGYGVRREASKARLRTRREDVPRVLICTPVRGGVAPHYAASLFRALKDEGFEAEVCDIIDIQQWSDDVVRTRSRLVTYFLNETDATHLLFLDSDVTVTRDCIRGMLAVGEDYVCAPYPRRDGVDWRKVDTFARLNVGISGETFAYTYNVRPLGGKIALDELRGVAEIEACGLGCTLLTRAMLESMVEHYGRTLGFTDRRDPARPLRHVALFQLVLDGDELLSEDYSFAWRWRRRAGNKVWLYLGPGSPCDHYGEVRHRGMIEAFNMRRVEKKQ